MSLYEDDIRTTLKIVLITDEDEQIVLTIRNGLMHNWVKYVVCIPEGAYHVVFEISLGATVNPRVSLGDIGIVYDSQLPPEDIYAISDQNPDYSIDEPEEQSENRWDYVGNPFKKMREDILNADKKQNNTDDPTKPTRLHQSFQCTNGKYVFRSHVNIIYSNNDRSVILPVILWSLLSTCFHVHVIIMVWHTQLFFNL